MDYFSDVFGLTTKNDPTTENGGLFFAHYLVLKDILGKEFAKGDLNLFQMKMFQAYIKEGLYLRSVCLPNRTVSQDEISGFFVSSVLLNTFHADTIWKRLLNGWLSYPATGCFKVYNPASYYAWAKMVDSKVSFIFLPFYIINLIISTNKPKADTSSKLIYFSELHIMQGFLHKYYVWRMKLMYGEKWVNELFKTYFGRTEESDFPLLQLASQI